MLLTQLSNTVVESGYNDASAAGALLPAVLPYGAENLLLCVGGNSDLDSIR